MNPCCPCHVQNHQNNNQHQKSVIIRHPKSGLVLDATDYEVKIQHFTGSTAQQWMLECTELGRFVILNKKNGKALDIEGGAEDCSKVITYPKHGDKNQQWYINSDGTIASPCNFLLMEIAKPEYYPGANIMVTTANAGDSQEFQLQHL